MTNERIIFAGDIVTQGTYKYIYDVRSIEMVNVGGRVIRNN